MPNHMIIITYGVSPNLILLPEPRAQSEIRHHFNHKQIDALANMANYHNRIYIQMHIRRSKNPPNELVQLNRT